MDLAVLLHSTNFRAAGPPGSTGDRDRDRVLAGPSRTGPESYRARSTRRSSHTGSAVSRILPSEPKTR